jgi:hypothetical protein
MFESLNLTTMTSYIGICTECADFVYTIPGIAARSPLNKCSGESSSILMTLPHRCAEEPSAASAEATAASNGVDDTPLVGGAAPTVVVEEVAPRLIRSRRKRWLELNPSYYTSASADVELSGTNCLPILSDVTADMR